MRTRYLVSGLLAAALLSSTAFAQTTQQSTNPPPPAATKTDAAMPKLVSPHWRASKMIGLAVYNEQNEKLGDINEIILDKDGKALGYVVGVGGFLGMGEHDILVEPSKLKFVNEPRRTQTSATNPPAGNPPATTPPATTRTDTNARAPRAATEQWYPDHAMMSGTKDQLKAMPQFKYSSYN
jgi:sporulation protein YlmC with PRC-barrel domain